MHASPATDWASRRQFIMSVASAGTIVYLGSREVFASLITGPGNTESHEIAFNFRSVSADHVPEIQAWIRQLDQEGKLSSHPVYRQYLGALEYRPPKELSHARSLVVLAIPQTISIVTFHLNGKAHDFSIPTGYVDDGITAEAIRDAVTRRVLKDLSKKLAPAKLPLKTLAVRSGLAEYGKNNITFAGDYGSLHALMAFYTDAVLDDEWGELKLLRLCKGCSICEEACPNRCLRPDNFVIDVGKCITLYNERPEPIPSHIDPKVHHALVGCLRCQATCPANQEAVKKVVKLADIDETETQLLLSGGENKKIRAAIVAKLKQFPAAADFAYFSRNLKLAWPNVVRV